MTDQEEISRLTSSELRNLRRLLDALGGADNITPETISALRELVSAFSGSDGASPTTIKEMQAVFLQMAASVKTIGQVGRLAVWVVVLGGAIAAIRVGLAEWLINGGDK